MDDGSWLRVEGLTVRFGGVMALTDVAFEHLPGEILGLIGPNGAGKTTLLNALTGLARPNTGTIHFMGDEIVGLTPQAIVGRGIVRTFQNTELYTGLNVRDNVLLGCHPRVDYGVFRAMLKTPGMRRRERDLHDEVDSILAKLGLARYADEPIDRLPYGVRKRVEIARAVALRPRVLLVDEPAAGATDADRAALVDDLRYITSELGASVILVEHDVGLVMRACDRIVVLNWGSVLAIGEPEEIRTNRDVEVAYLGG